MLTGNSIQSNLHSAETPKLNWVLSLARCCWASKPGTFSLNTPISYRNTLLVYSTKLRVGEQCLWRAHCSASKRKTLHLCRYKTQMWEKGAFIQQATRQFFPWMTQSLCLIFTRPIMATKVAFLVQVFNLKRCYFVWHMTLQLIKTLFHVVKLVL